MKLFPRLFGEDECAMIRARISLEEVKNTLTHFPKGKSPGPDGWTIELYLHFFDLLGYDITTVIDEIRRAGGFLTF